MNVRTIIHSLDYEDLQQLKYELSSGNTQLIQLINRKIEDKEKHHGTVCTTCAASIDPRSRHNYTLVFGPIDFRKRASFCAVDCLQYFLVKMKKR
jgi:hypothetical protein